MKPFYPKSRSAFFALAVIATLALSACKNMDPAKEPEIVDGVPQPESRPLDHPQTNLTFAKSQFEHGNYEVADYFLRKALLKSPEEPLAIKMLPWAYFYQERFRAALTSFERAHALFPKDPDPLIGMGWAYFIFKDYERALEHFSRAEELRPDSPQVHKGKAFAYLRQKKRDRAIKQFALIYEPVQIRKLLALWRNSGADDPNAALKMVPTPGTSASLFTLPVEHPRYPGKLLGLPYEKNPILEEAWELFQDESYYRAMIRFEKLAKKGNNSLDNLNGLAWSYLKNWKLRKADLLFDKILKSHSNFPGALLGRSEVDILKDERAAVGQRYLDYKKLIIARETLTDLAERFPDWSTPVAKLGYADLKGEQYSSAQELFLKAMDIDPGDKEAERGMAEVQEETAKTLYKANRALKAGDYKSAAPLFFDYIEEQGPQTELDPYLAQAYNGLGWTHYEKRHYDLALGKFLRAIKWKTLKADSAKGAGLTYYQMGEFEQAARYLLMAYQAHPDDTEVAYKLDNSVVRGWDRPDAFDFLKKELAEHPLRSSVYMNLGWIYHDWGNHDLGIEYQLKAISLDPEFALNIEMETFLEKSQFGWQVYNRVGWTYFHRGNNARAMKMFRLSLKRAPRESEPRKGIGYVLFQRGEYEQAGGFLKDSLDRDPDPAPVLETIRRPKSLGPYKLLTSARTKLARVHILLGNNEEAIKLLNQELNLHPNRAAAYDGLGWVYLQRNRLPEARLAFTQALRLEPLNNLSHKGLNEVKYRSTRAITRRENAPNVSGALPVPPSVPTSPN